MDMYSHEGDGLDLNSQAAEEFLHIWEYENYLQSDGGQGGGTAQGSSLPTLRAPRTLGVRKQRVAGGRGGRAARAAGRARQLHFGASSSAPTGRGGQGGSMFGDPDGGVFLGGSSSGPPRRQGSNSTGRGGAHRGQRGRGGGRGASTAGPPLASGDDYYTNLDYEDDDWDDIEDLGSSGGPPNEGNGERNAEHGDASSDDGGSTSSSENELLSMALRNLKMAQQLIVQVAPMFGMYFDKYFVKRPGRVPTETGLQWVQRTLAHDVDCYDMFRVERPLFNRLHNTLAHSYGLQSTSRMSSVEALGLFLWTVGSTQPFRQARNRLVRSLETISRTFDRVLTCVLKLTADIIKPKDPEFSTVHPYLENPNFWPYFNDYIGAIDGTHINVVVPKSLVVQHMNKHHETTQNELAVCDFDMRFTFVLAGWPGSAHDMRVFNDAMAKYGDKFPHPPQGKYYVVDAGYPNRSGYLSPYMRTRYHVDQWKDAPPPQGMKETFNHAHSQVRNVIERSFGVLKMKWRMLLAMPQFPARKQTRIIVACVALHNFIRESRIADRDFDMCDADANYFPIPHSAQDNWPSDEPFIEDSDMNDFRDELTNALFHGL